MAYIPFLNNAYFSAKVGIGTTSPDSKLEIFDSSSSTDPTTLDSNFLLLTNGDATEVSETWGVGFNTKNSLGTNKLGAYVHAIGNYSSNYNTSLAFGTRGVTAGTSATERMRIDSAGNVGIGTTNPQAPLVISNSSTDGLEFHNSISSSSRIISYKRSNNTFRPLRLEALTHIFSISGNEKMRIDSSGNVGIGTTSPGGKLEVDGQYGDLKIGDPSLGTQITYYDTTRILMNSADIKFYTNSLTERMTIESNGNVGIGTASPSVKLDIRLSGTTGKVAELHNSVGYGVGFTVESDGGVNTINSESNQALAFATNGSSNERIRITSGGNVGIGTTSPGSKLSIGGTTGSYGSGIGFEPTGTGARIYRTFIGTDGSFRFDDVTAGFLTRLAITSSGNVGIGTTNPSGVLHIKKDNALATFEIQGGLNTQTTAGAVNGEINFGVNDPSTTGGIGASIKNISQISNGAHNGLAFYTGLQGRTPYLQQMLYFTAQGGLSFGTSNSAYGTSGQILKSNADAPPTWVAASTVIGGPYLPLAGGTMTGVTQFNDHTQHGDQVSAKWGASNDLTIQHNGTNSVIANSVGNLYISNHADDKDIIFESDNGSGASVSYLTLDGSTTHAYFSNPGNVGIGTTSPSQKLQVSTSNYNVSKFVGNTSNGTGYVGAVLEIETNNDERGRGVYLTHRNATDTSDSEWYAGVPYNGGGYSIGNAAYATSIDSAAGPAHKDQSKLFIAESGNVGIGTTSPALQSGGTGLHIDATTSSELKFTNDTTGITASDGTALVSTGNNFTINNREAGNITLGTSNSTRMTILSAGNVGIGTTSPGTALHVVSGGIGVQGTTGATALTVPGIWMGSDGTNALIYGRQASTWKPTYLDSSALYINAQSGGNVGIGTTSPSQKLQVSTSNYNVSKFVGNTSNGTGYVGAVLEIETNNDERGRGVYLTHRNATDTSDSEWYAGVPYNGGGYSIGNAAYATSIDSAAGPAHKDQSKLFIAESGNVGIGTTSPALQSGGTGLHIDATTSSELKFTNDTTGITASDGTALVSTGNNFTINNREAGNITLGTSNSTRMTILSAGNVGIGTTSPGTALHVVSGGIGVQGTTGATALTVPGIWMGSDGTNALIYGRQASTWKPTYLDSSALYINAQSGGNVGIGTTSPTANLDVTSTLNQQHLYVQGGYAEGTGALARIKTTGNGNVLLLESATTSDSREILEVKNTNGTVFLVRGDGNVGIGTTSPSAKLEVAGAISTGNGASVRSEISSPIGSGNASLLFASNAGNINTNTAEFIFTNSLYGSSTRNELMRIDSSGYVGIGTASPSEKLHVDGNTLISAEKYYYTAGTGGGFGSDASGNFKIRQNDADLIFGSGNNVGIGTTSPLEKLEVQGTVYATPISYAANQSAYALKMGASNNTAFDMGIKAKSTSTGGPYMSFCSANTDDVIVVKNSNVGINTANPSYNLDVTGNGRFTSTVTATNFILSSDKRLKNNVEEVNNNHIDVNWKTFEMNSEEGQSRYGVIAQELEEVHPEFVRTDDEGMKSVAYIDLLIAKIAELEARLEKLEK